MKILRILSFVLVLASGLSCTSQAKIQYYDMPADIAAEAKTANLTTIEKGRILYNINCAKCHNTKDKGKIFLPDFTNEQLESYTIRIKNEVHVNSLPENKVTAEELEAIQFFFAYKKPSKPVLEK